MAAARTGVVAVLLALLALLGGPGMLPATAARTTVVGPATTPFATHDDVQIQLASVTPGVARPGAEVTLRGTLRNLGGRTVSRPVVTVSRTVVGLDTRAAVAAWADGSSKAKPSSAIARRVLTEPLPAHQSIPFAVTVRPGAIDSSYRFTSLGLNLEAREGTGADATTVGHLRTFLPWDRTRASSHNPIKIAWVLPLTLPADPALFGPESDDRTQAWLHAIGAGSSIARLLEATADDPVTWALDPAMVAPPASQGEFPPPGGTPTQTATAPGTPTTPGPSGQATGTSPTAPSTTPNPEVTEPMPTSPTDGSTDGASDTAPTGPAPTSPTDDTGSTSPTGASTMTSSATTSPGPAPTPAPPSPNEVDRLTDELATQLRTAGPDHPLWALPYGDPDLTALLRLAPDGDALRDALRTPTPQSLGDTVRADVAWAIGGTLGGPQVAALRRVWKAHGGLGAAVVPATALDGTTGFTGSAARRSAQGLPLLAYDERLSGVFSHMDDPNVGAAAVQRFLAETLAVYQQQPATDRDLLVAPPRTFEGDPDVLAELFAGVDHAGWLAPTSTGTLLRAARKAPREKKHTLSMAPRHAARGDLTAYPAAQVSPLTARRLDRLDRLRASTAGISSILAQGKGYQDIWSAATDQLLSGRWRTRPSAWPALRARVTQANSDVAKGVSVVASTFNFFADRGSLQLTVVNDLDVGVQDINLTLTPRNPRLRILAQPGPLRIGPHSRTTVKVKVDAISAGLVPVDAHLSSTNGTTLGSETSVTVRVQPTSTWIYWVLGIVGGLILVVGLSRALRRGGHAPIDPGTHEETPDP